MAYLVSLESAGCLPDSQIPAYTWADAVEAAKDMFENERDPDTYKHDWVWAVYKPSKKQTHADGSAVYASQNRGLYSVVITVVDEETAKAWEEE